MSHKRKTINQEVKVENKLDVEGLEVREEGIKEIIKEVKAIEAKLDSPTFGLAEIKTEVAAIERKLDSPTFGLAEIKTEVAAIERKLDSPTFGLIEIKSEIAAILTGLSSSTSGLVEIKSEIAAIFTEITSSTTGLAEIKSEVAAILTEVTSTTHGLAEIKTEVAAIERKLDSPTFGLIEIKSEIAAILTAVSSQPGPGFTGDLTTGAVVADNGASSLVAKVLNNTKSVQTVVVDVWNLDTCPKSLLGVSTFVIGTMCSAFNIFEIKTEVPHPTAVTEYEVDFLGIKPGIYAWTAARSNGANAPLSSSNFIDVNTFRHSELVPLVDP